MRLVSDNTAIAIVAPITQPGYLVEILLETPVRLCSRGTLTVLGNEWQDYSFAISGLGIDAAKGTQEGSIVFQNSDQAISTLVLLYGLSDVTINVWKFYGDAPADDDPLLIFSGVGGAADIDTKDLAVTLTLRQAADRVQYAPNDYITAEMGFSLLPAPGTILAYGDAKYELTPEEF